MGVEDVSALFNVVIDRSFIFLGVDIIDLHRTLRLEQLRIFIEFQGIYVSNLVRIHERFTFKQISVFEQLHKNKMYLCQFVSETILQLFPRTPQPKPCQDSAAANDLKMNILKRLIRNLPTVFKLPKTHFKRTKMQVKSIQKFLNTKYFLQKCKQ